MFITFPYSTDYTPSAPVITVTIAAKHSILAEALLDSGADGTIIPLETLRAIDAPYLRNQRMRGVTGHPENVEIYLVTVQIGDHKLPGVRAAATSGTDELIIGRDVLNQFIITLDGIGGTTEIS